MFSAYLIHAASTVFLGQNGVRHKTPVSMKTGWYLWAVTKQVESGDAEPDESLVRPGPEPCFKQWLQFHKRYLGLKSLSHPQ